MPTWLQLLFDIASLIPMASEAKDVIAITEDVAILAVQINALPQTKKVEASLEAFIKKYGGTVAKDVGGRIVGYSIPANGDYPGARGGSMWTGANAIEVGK